MKKSLIMLLALPVLLASLVTPVAADDAFYSTNLNIGRDAVDVGDFTTTLSGDINDDPQITFTYLIDVANTDWRLDETHLYVGDAPPTKSAPGRFPYKDENLGGVVSDEYAFNLSEIDLDGDLIVYVAAHAQLTRQTGVDEAGEPIYAYETTWAQGDNPIGKGKNWATYFVLDFNEEPPE